jgi:hypothetical protein
MREKVGARGARRLHPDSREEENGEGRRLCGGLRWWDSCKPDFVLSVAGDGRSFLCSSRSPRSAFAFRGATNTRGVSRLTRESGQAARSSVLSCTTWGFSCPRDCSRGGGLLPRLFTLAPRQARGGLFSVTLSVGGDFRSRLPRILRGMSPYGVRTFLCRYPSGVN